ncbi:helix-turn-helix transcriptional regulator [Oscillospiraceae bacterium PP1C4]
MSDLSAALGIRIRELRKARNISQEELGFKASISAAHLGQIERGLKKPTVDTLGKIASALGISIQELFAFDAPTVPVKPSATLDKITAYLSAMTEEQQKDLFKVIKIFKRCRESES